MVRFLADASGFITDSAGARVHSVPCIVQLLFHLAISNHTVSTDHY